MRFLFVIESSFFFADCLLFLEQKMNFVFKLFTWGDWQTCQFSVVGDCDKCPLDKADRGSKQSRFLLDKKRHSKTIKKTKKWMFTCRTHVQIKTYGYGTQSVWDINPWLQKYIFYHFCAFLNPFSLFYHRNFKNKSDLKLRFFAFPTNLMIPARVWSKNGLNYRILFHRSKIQTTKIIFKRFPFRKLWEKVDL